MNDKERKEFINSIKENDLDKTATFSDLMSRAERKQHELDKKREAELVKEKELQEKTSKNKKKDKKSKKNKETDDLFDEIDKIQTEKEKNLKEQPKRDKDKKQKLENELSKTNKINSLENTRELKAIVKEQETKKKEKPKNFFKSLIITTILLLSVGYFIYTLLFCDTFVNQLFMIINSLIIMLISLTNILGLVKSISKSKFWILLNSLFVIIFILFNLLVNLNILKIPTNNVVKDFTGVNINKAIKWAEANNIKYYQVYEYSDNIEEFCVISQNIKPNTVVKNIKDIEFVVSKGPNLDKEVIISNMVGWNIDDVIKVIDDNFLSNVTINYIFSDEYEKDIVISQNTSGQIKRNEKLVITVSLGKESDLKPVKSISLINKSEFKATLWLKRNGISYEIKYEFSNKISKGYVMEQSIKSGNMINQKTDKMIITISKGAKIKVPDLKKMAVDEIIAWVSSNNLKISFEERFDATVKAGSVIEANYKEGDEIEEGTTIKIVTSKGVLKMKSFTSLSEFRTWASRYGVNINEVYEFNNDVKQGEIIKFSHDKGAIINYNDTVTVYVSDGKAIVVPDFYGKTKSSIQTTCNNLGLNCTFYYVNSSKTKDTAVSQNKKADSEVIKGTYVNIGLSGGSSYGTSSGSSSGSSSSGSSGSGSSGSSSSKPSCDTSQKTTVYIDASLLSPNNPTATCSNIKNAYPNIKFNCTYVSGTGITPGLLVNSSSIDEHSFDHCNTVTLKISQN